MLFLDEIHRFTKAQQDALLPGVENGWVILVAATTENPSFSVISPLLSRSLLLTLEPLGRRGPRRARRPRARRTPRGLAGAVELADEARAMIIRLASGDARRALTALEAAAASAMARRPGRGDAAGHRRAGRGGGGPRAAALRPAGRRALRRDQRVHQVGAGERRRCLPALPRADDRGRRGSALHRAAHHHQRRRGHRHGRPAGARRSRSRRRTPCSSSACRRAASRSPRRWCTSRPRRSRTPRTWRWMRRSPTSGPADRPRARSTCAMRTTRAPSASATARATSTRTTPRSAWSQQQYLPDELVGTEYYQPTQHGNERDVAARLERLRAILRGS